MAFSKFRAKKGIQIATDTTPSGVDVLPVGSIIMWSGPTAPHGFLLCDGSAVSRTTYSDLFDFMNQLRFPYGGGDGSTTFHVPDFRGRFPRGIGTGTVGIMGGSETHVLVTENIPDHQHNVPAHNHTLTGGNMNASGTHSHSFTSNSGYDSVDHAHNLNAHSHTWFSATDCAGSGSRLRASANPTGNYSGIYAPGSGYSTGNQSANHVHNVTHNSGDQSTANHTHTFTTSATTSNTDSGNTTGGAFAASAVNHMNPFLVTNFLIKY